MTLHYLLVRDQEPELRRRMKELAQTRIRYGYRRHCVAQTRRLAMGGQAVPSHLYREVELQLRLITLPKRHKMAAQRRQRHAATRLRSGEVCSMDFVADQFCNGGKSRILTMVDVFV